MPEKIVYAMANVPLITHKTLRLFRSRSDRKNHGNWQVRAVEVDPRH